MPKTEPLLTAKEAGLILDKSARTVHRMVEAGTLKSAQRLPGPKGAYLFHRRDVEAYVRAQAKQALDRISA